MARDSNHTKKKNLENWENWALVCAREFRLVKKKIVKIRIKHEFKCEFK